MGYKADLITVENTDFWLILASEDTERWCWESPACFSFSFKAKDYVL